MMGTFATPSLAKQKVADGKIGDLRITILSTMLVSTQDNTREGGFSALAQADGHQVPVDTGGAPETVLKNVEKLGVDLSGVWGVIRTHNRADHTRGLLMLWRSLSKRNREVLFCMHVEPEIFGSRPANNREESPMIAIRPA